MEFFLELCLTVFLSLFFAFIFAKLVSVASATDVDRIPAEDLVLTTDLAGDSVLEEKPGRSVEEREHERKSSGLDEKEVFVERVERICEEDGGSEEKEVELVKAREFGGESVEGLELGGETVEFREGEVDDGGLEEEKKVELEGENDEKRDEFDVAKEVKEKDGGIVVEVVKEESGEVREGVERVRDLEEKEKVEKNVDEKQSLFDEEDDWEGIERSELEKKFGDMVQFVDAGNVDGILSKVGSDVHMQLYGLQKVATEGPCLEAQPSLLKPTARAKWHAWQRLGNMNPEVAMEQYISLLSDSIPGYTGKKPTEAKKLDEGNRAAEGIASTNAGDLSSLSPMKEEVCYEGRDAVGGPKIL